MFNVLVKEWQVPPSFELGSLDSKSRVLTITPWDPSCFVYFSKSLENSCKQNLFWTDSTFLTISCFGISIRFTNMLEIRVNSGEGYVCHQKIATLTPHSQLIKTHSTSYSQNETDIIQLGSKADLHLRVKSAIAKATLKSRSWCTWKLTCT